MIARLASLLLFALLAASVPLASQAQADPASLSPEPAEVEPASRDILVMLNLPPPHLQPGGGYSGRYGAGAAQTARVRLARRISREHRLEFIESWPMPLLGVDCIVMRVPEDRPVEEAIARLNQRRDVVWSQPLNVYHTMASPARPDDPLFPVQPAATEWQLGNLHRVATGKGARVAVIDSQVDTSHPDLEGQFVGSRDFVSPPNREGEGHGTGIAGIIGARAGNNLGIAGVAPDARLLALRACRERPARAQRAACDSLALAKALHFAIDSKAHVINLSLSGPHDKLLESLIAVGIERNIAIVTAYDPRLPGGGFPASQPGVLPIAEEALRSVPASVYRAPGRDIPTTRPGGSWGLVSGSSFATAHVSGLLALVHERRHAKTPIRLIRSAGGVVNACATLAPVTADCDCSCATNR